MAPNLQSILNLLVVLVVINEVSANTLNGTNLALGKTAIQSSDYLFYVAEKAVDGITSGVFYDLSCTHTTPYEVDVPVYEWWEVDLGAVFDISDIIIYNRIDCCGDRLKDFVIEGGQDCVNSSLTCYTPCYTQLEPINVTEKITCSFCRARYVRIRLNQFGILTLCEVEVYGQPGTISPSGTHKFSNETAVILESPASTFSSYPESSFMESTWVIPETSSFEITTLIDMTSSVYYTTTLSPTEITTNVTVETVTNEFCSCRCRKIEDDPDVFEEKLNEIKKNLTLSVVKLSSSRRKKTSATDDRPSASSVGYVGVVILSVVMGLMVIQDILSALIFIFTHIKLAITHVTSIKSNAKRMESNKDELNLGLPRNGTIILNKGKRIGNTVIVSDI